MRRKRKEKKKDKKRKQVLERLKTGRVGCCEAALVSGCRVGLTMLEPCNLLTIVQCRSTIYAPHLGRPQEFDRL